MPSLKQLSLEKGRVASQEIPVSRHVPYLRHVSEDTIRTREGYFLQVIEVPGMSFETADQWHINQRLRDRAQVLQGISDSRIAVYTHVIRVKKHEYPAEAFTDQWAKGLDASYQAKLEKKNLFFTRQFITIVRRSAQGKVHMLPKLLDLISGKVDAKQNAAQERDALDHLDKVSGQLLKSFANYGAKRLKMREEDGAIYSDILSFFHYLLNFEEKDKVAVSDMELAEYLPASRISFGAESFEIRGASPDAIRLGAVLSLKHYPYQNSAGMLDKALRLPFEFIITQSFAFSGRQEALSNIETQRRKIVSGDEGATSLSEDLHSAMDEGASGFSSFGWHHMTIVPHANNAKELKEAINSLMTACSEVGITPVREDLNMESAFWAQLPANFGYIARPAMITNHNFAGFSPFHTFPFGKAHGNHWGDAITLLETTSGTPFYFSFHERDVGNTTVIGPTGTGKTVLLSFLTAQSLRHNPRVFYFDKDRGADLFIRAIGGEYSVVEQGRPSGFNPFQLPDTLENRAFLKDFLRVLATVDDKSPLSIADQEQISIAIEKNFEVDPAHRTLTQISSFFSGYGNSNDIQNSLERRLSKWYGGGEWAWLFDNETDALSLDNPIIGFDLTSILDLPYARIPWLMYVFWRVDHMLDGRKTIIILDEGWKLLDDEVFAKRIKDWEKTIRKLNGLLVFATQSVSDAVKSSVGTSIIEQSPTQIFLPNGKALESDYVDGFKLTYQEYMIIRGLSPESHQFLVKQGHNSVIAKLDLSGMSDEIAVLSGRAETVRLADQIREEVGNDPAIWLPIFHAKRKSL